jgi:hypothetical protein
MDREMLPEDRARLLAHLNECAGCSATADALRLQDADLRRVFASRRGAAAAVAERVIGQIRAAPLRHKHAWFPWVLALTSAAAGFLLAVLLFRPWVRMAPGPEVVRREPLPEDNKPAVTVGAQAREEEVKLAYCCPPGSAIEVQLPQQSTWEPVKEGQGLLPGTRVRTGPDLRCELHAADGSAVRLNSRTEVVVAAPRQFNLVLGQIMARVAPAHEAFEVHLADATVTALGTEFDVLRGSGETVLSVLEGQTRVDLGNLSRVVREGSTAVIRDGRVEEVRKRSVQVANWTRDLILLKGRNNPELNSLVLHQLDDIMAQLGRLKMESADESEIRSLGDHCVLPLARYIQSDRSKSPQDSRKRHTAARILSDLAQPWSVGDLVLLLGDADGEVRFQAARALKRLTGATFGAPEDWRNKSEAELKSGLQEWQTWWQNNQNRYPSMAP